MDSRRLRSSRVEACYSNPMLNLGIPLPPYLPSSATTRAAGVALCSSQRVKRLRYGRCTKLVNRHERARTCTHAQANIHGVNRSIHSHGAHSISGLSESDVGNFRPRFPSWLPCTLYCTTCLCYACLAPFNLFKTYRLLSIYMLLSAFQRA